MLSNKKIICPNNLINVAKKKGTIDAAIVNAGEIFPMESVHKAVQHNLINPTFIGNENEIKKYAEKLKWNISKYKIIDEKEENNTAPIAAKLASEGKVKIIVKGHIHTDILMKAVLKRNLNLIGKKRLSHVWHMTLTSDDKPFIITDGVVNVLPKLEVKMHILRNAVDFANKIGISKPKESATSANFLYCSRYCLPFGVITNTFLPSYSILLTSPAPVKLLTNFSSLECERLAFESNEVVLIPCCPH